MMLKKGILIAAAVQTLLCTTTAFAATHTVVSGDTMWKIAVKYQAGLDEIINANPQISNPALIYPGQKLNIPGTDSQVLDYENEVIRLVNEIRAENGLKALVSD